MTAARALPGEAPPPRERPSPEGQSLLISAISEAFGYPETLDAPEA